MNPWSVTSFENIFSHSVGCLFVCNLLCCAKVFKFNRVPFVYFLLLFPLSRRLVGEGNGNPLQYSCLENPMDRGAWWAAVYEVAKSRT